jgi:hypothetical protein
LEGQTKVAVCCARSFIKSQFRAVQAPLDRSPYEFAKQTFKGASLPVTKDMGCVSALSTLVSILPASPSMLDRILASTTPLPPNAGSGTPSGTRRATQHHLAVTLSGLVTLMCIIA